MVGLQVVGKWILCVCAPVATLEPVGSFAGLETLIDFTHIESNYFSWVKNISDRSLDCLNLHKTITTFWEEEGIPKPWFSNFEFRGRIRFWKRRPFLFRIIDIPVCRGIKYLAIQSLSLSSTTQVNAASPRSHHLPVVTSGNEPCFPLHKFSRVWFLLSYSWAPSAHRPLICGAASGQIWEIPQEEMLCVTGSSGRMWTALLGKQLKRCCLWDLDQNY